MQEERCEVCGENVPHDAMRAKGRLRCCLRCAKPPVVIDGPAAAHPPESLPVEKNYRRFGIAADGIDECYPVGGVTLRMRVAMLGIH